MSDDYDDDNDYELKRSQKATQTKNVQQEVWDGEDVDEDVDNDNGDDGGNDDDGGDDNDDDDN